MNWHVNLFHTRTRRIAAGTLLLLSVTFVCLAAEPLPQTTAVLLLLSVLIIATFGDRLVAIFLSLGASLAMAYFLPPSDSFKVSGSAGWIALVVFLSTAAIGSQLSVRAERRAHEAEDRNREMQRIHALGRALLAHDTVTDTIKAAVRQIVSGLGATGASLYLDQRERSHQSGAIPDVDLILRRVFQSGEPWTGSVPQIAVHPLASGDHRIGALAVQARNLSPTAVSLTVNLVAVALERAIASEKAIEASAISRNVELRRAMVDAFAHNLKTPLTSIKASASALLRRSSNLNQETRELLTVVDEETDRLTRLIADSLDLVRVGERVTPVRTVIPIAQPIQIVLADFTPRLEGRSLEVDIPSPVPAVLADAHLIQMVMSQLLDNALKYSPPDSPIFVRAYIVADTVVVTVQNRGVPIEDDERQRIFDQFYRGRGNRSRIEGTGMGLSIARTIVESHGGNIKVCNEPDDLVVFQFSLPLVRENEREIVTV